ncbi:PorP/SprF family type IX secretion system membrane protein [Limnovirga soli]|nr:PorP/SprF family type IX secretion system membrane protein [Limnovirga soli]
MKKIFTRLLLLLAGVVSFLWGNTQDLTFSQFYEQPLQRNPALAGVFTGDVRVSSAYRNQWASVTTPFRTTALSIEYKIPVNDYDDVTFGSQMMVDDAGDISLKRTQILPAINFHKSLGGYNNSYLSAAFMGGPVKSAFNAAALSFGDQFQGGEYNATNATAQIIKSAGYSYWDMTAGLCYSAAVGQEGHFYVAASMSHFAKPKIKSVISDDASFIQPKYSFNVGINAPVSYTNRIIAFADYFTQNGNRQILGGLMYGFDVTEYYTDEEPVTFYIGSFVRWNDAIIPVVKLDFQHMSVGVSYDVNYSKLKAVSNSRGGVEITASYKGFLKVRNSTLDQVKCVKF